MFTLNYSLLSATIHLFILFLVLLDKWHEVKWTLFDEDNLAIFDASVCITLFLNNATLPNIHWLKEVVSPDFNRSFPLSFKRDNSAVIESRFELNMVCIASMRQVCCLVECTVPVLLTLTGLFIEELAVSLTHHLHSREYLPRAYQHLFEHFRVGFCVILVDCRVIKQGWHVIFSFVQGLLNYIGNRANESIDFTVGALADFQENDGALADDLVDDES